MDDDRKARIEALRKKRMAKNTAISATETEKVPDVLPSTIVPEPQSEVNKEIREEEPSKEAQQEPEQNQPHSQNNEQQNQKIDPVAVSEPTTFGPTDDLKKDIRYYLDKLKMTSDKVINQFIQEKYEASLIEK